MIRISGYLYFMKQLKHYRFNELWLALNLFMSFPRRRESRKDFENYKDIRVYHYLNILKGFYLYYLLDSRLRGNDIRAYEASN
ncbi:hypothetical protein H6P87_00148 [Rickettsia tillamookensis]|uniref:Uncharacterized protein n=1 Tax=Rickettsia tillamookensis TaxID=2761623 RepID=A0A9E6MGK1_9RICK|nr:hypothetical protein H6P87_00148 [Rickettsia tillamookensis]